MRSAVARLMIGEPGKKDLLLFHTVYNIDVNINTVTVWSYYVRNHY